MRPFHSTIQLQEELDILQVKDACRTSLLEFVFQCIYHNPLAMFKEYYQKHRSLHDRNVRDQHISHVPEGYSALALLSSKIHGAKLRNELPLEIRKLDDISCFKKALQRRFVESNT